LGHVGQLPFSILSSLWLVVIVAGPAAALFKRGGRSRQGEGFYKTLLERPKRYFLAGLLFALASAIGLLLCVFPALPWHGLPVYVNKDL